MVSITKKGENDHPGSQVLIAEADADRVAALESSDALTYFRLCSELGVDPEDELLFERGEMEHILATREIDNIESLAEGYHRSHNDPAERKTPRVWGIRKGSDLGSLSYRSLDFIFRGINNLEIPAEMAEVMNPDEMLAKFYAAGIMKMNDAHVRKPAYDDFMVLYRKMDELVYCMRDFAAMARDCNRRFPSTTGKQRERLEQLEPEVREAFVESFKKGYRPSTREQPDNPRAYWDPNIDGQSKEAYVNQIYRILADRWSRAEEQRQRKR